MDNQNDPTNPINNGSNPPEPFVAPGNNDLTPPPSGPPAPTQPQQFPAPEPSEAPSLPVAPAADPTATQPVTEQSTPEAKSSKKWLKPIVLIAVILVVVIGSGLLAWALLRDKSPVGTVAGFDCAQTSAPLTDSSAKSAYKVFVQALKSGDQACVDKLSTDVFQKVRSQTYAASDGKWLAKSGDNSGIGDFKKLPNDLNADKFTTAEYIRADYSAFPGLEDAGQPEGLTAKYTVEGDKGSDLHLNLSFVEEDDKILVDDLAVIPAQLDDDSDEF